MQAYELAMMSGAGAFLWPLLSFLGYTPILIYLISRWRAYREQTPPDPQLGLKVAFGFFRLLGLQLALLGASLASWALLLGDDGDGGTVLRIGLGLLLPGVLIFAAHVMALARTNDAEAPAVGRMYLGATMVLDGLIATASLVGLSVLGLQKSAPGDALRLLIITTFVFGVAWVVLARRLVKRLRVIDG